MDTNKRIYYLATKDALVNTFKQLYRTQGYEFIELQAAQGPPNDLSNLLLIEPLLLHREYYSVNRLWKNFLYKHQPQARLIVATYAQSRHANLFSLFDFPKELEPFLDQTKPVGDYPFIHIGTEEKFGEIVDKHMDSWTISLPHSGRPALTEMQRFLDGHDRNKSFTSQLYSMRSLVRTWLNVTVEEKEKSWDVLKQEFIYLLQRWYFYNKLFDYLPFADSMQLISQMLQDIKEQIDAGNNPDESVQEKLSKIYDITQEVINPIVFPLDYW